MATIKMECAFEVGSLSEVSEVFSNNLSENDNNTVYDAISKTSEAPKPFNCIEFLSDNPSYVEKALDGFGWNTGDNIFNIIEMGYNLMIIDDITEHLENELLNFAYDYMENKGCQEVTKSFADDFTEKRFDSNTQIADIKSFLDDYINEHDLSQSVDEKLKECVSRVSDSIEEQTISRDDDAR